MEFTIALSPFPPHPHPTMLNLMNSITLPVPLKFFPLRLSSDNPATELASQSRQKNGAPFTCPVEGCRSTFTRQFNLKGHLCSHREEQPYVCKWPKCGKGFARQHDCKCHEALHLNIHPLCGKNDGGNNASRVTGGTMDKCMERFRGEVIHVDGDEILNELCKPMRGKEMGIDARYSVGGCAFSGPPASSKHE